MKKILALFLTVITAFGLACCNRYSSTYVARGFIKQEVGAHCQAEFNFLKGRYVFRIHKSDGDGEIAYAGSLEEGELHVYYDSLGTKEFLFSLKAGESVESCGGYFESGSTVYVILEAVGAAKGSVYIDLVSQRREV